MYIIDIPSGDGTGPSSDSGSLPSAAQLARTAELISMAKRKPPLVEVSVNGDEAIIEAVNLLRSARTQMEMLTNTINERFNVTFVGVGEQVGSIVSNINTITDNVAHSSSNLNQPVLFMLFMCVFLLIFIVILLFCILRTRREFRKRKTFRASTASPRPHSFGGSGSGIAARRHRGDFASEFRRRLADTLRPSNRVERQDESRQPATQALRKSSNASNTPCTTANVVSMDPKASAPPMSVSTSTAAALDYGNAPTLPKKKSSLDSLV